MDKRKERKEVIKSIGGVPVVEGIFGHGKRAIYHWIKTGFPAHTYLIFSEELAKVGKSPDPSLWNFETRSDAAE